MIFKACLGLYLNSLKVFLTLKKPIWRKKSIHLVKKNLKTLLKVQKLSKRTFDKSLKIKFCPKVLFDLKALFFKRNLKQALRTCLELHLRNKVFKSKKCF